MTPEWSSRLEEEVLFLTYAGHGDSHDPVVLRTLGEHAMIRHRADALAAQRPRTPACSHSSATSWPPVRLEEGEVFPLIERGMPEHEPDAVAHALEAAHPARVTGAAGTGAPSSPAWRRPCPGLLDFTQ
jgi:hypothetical protein